MHRHLITPLLFGCLIAPGITFGAPLTTPWIVNPANGHWYALTAGPYAWVRAEVSAIQNGGHLATIRNQAEQDFVFQTFGNYGGTPRLLWIGLNDFQTEGQMRWTSGEPVTYTNWYPGEPNNGVGGDEDWVSIYPQHVGQGRWNDYNHVLGVGGAGAYGVIEFNPASPVNYPISFKTSSDWLYLAPEGDRTGVPLEEVGLAYEAAHPDWNTNLAFDVSNWAPAVDLADDWIWGANTASPVYFRYVFHLDHPVRDAVMFATIDDNEKLYINGQLVINDPVGGASDFGPVDITNYLHPGDNLIAIKAQNLLGPAAMSVHIFAVPEPSSFLLMLAGAAASPWFYRRTRRSVPTQPVSSAA